MGKATVLAVLPGKLAAHLRAAFQLSSGSGSWFTSCLVYVFKPFFTITKAKRIWGRGGGVLNKNKQTDPESS